MVLLTCECYQSGRALAHTASLGCLLCALSPPAASSSYTAQRGSIPAPPSSALA